MRSEMVNETNDQFNITEKDLIELDILQWKQNDKKLPTKEDMIALQRKLGISGGVLRHEQAVMRKARNLAHNITKVDVNMELVKIGALVHDIGRFKTHGMQHAIIGANLLRSLGYPEGLALIAERHLMAGLTAEEANAFGLPAYSIIPKTIEEKLVCLADKFMSGTKNTSIEKRFGKWIAKYGETEFLLSQTQRARDLEEEILRLIF